METDTLIRRSLIAGAIAATLAGCATTTPTEPPKVELPAPTVAQLDLSHWWTSFDDPALTSLVDEALANNLDLEVAMARIDAARAQVRLARADLYPSLDLGVGVSRSKVTEVGTVPIPRGISPTGNDFRVGLSAAYEIDLWGKYRTATRAAQNDLLATQYARETVRTAVAAQVAQTYFGLIAADAQLQLLKDTLALREQTVSLQTDRAQAGVIGQYDLAQAKAERDAVRADIATAQRAVSQFESALAVVVGRSPRDVFQPAVAREPSVAKLLEVPTVPAGLPSDVLERRPDLRQLESQLAAASLRIDRARADYLPSLNLTGTLGTESEALRHLLSGPSLIWSIGAGLAQPLFNLDRIGANVETQSARREELVATYRQTVQTAFKDVHDALAANETTRAALAAQTTRREALQQAYELSDLRYKAGYSPYLEVLDAQRQLLQAQTLSILAARDVRLALVDLAKALGGGWNYKEAIEPAKSAAR
ncbi:MAG TPA: efflux transporter outer membrane subunit [Casimicrobiaceae bacterium]|nr:efflux transporter outer membrane subunit [Casimicrobiaceae bacterium]